MKHQKFLAQFKEWAAKYGYTENLRTGAFEKEVEDKEYPGVKRKYRYHISKSAIRKEVRHGDRWLRLRSGYIKDLSFNAEGKLCGLTAAGCQAQKPASCQPAVAPLD